MTTDIFIILTGAMISSIGFFLYLRDTFKGSTKPHMFTRLLWALMWYIWFAIQIIHWAGYASLIMLWFSIIPTLVFFYTLKSAEKDIAPVDYVFLFGAFVALVCWLVFDQAILSVLLLLSIDYCAYFPTFRKSYMKPYEETISLFVFVNFWYLASFLTFDTFIFENYWYPTGLFLMNTVFVVFVLLRRKQLWKI